MTAPRRRRRRSSSTSPTFTRFLWKQRKRDDAIGDLARDWIHDHHRGKPRGAYEWPAVELYLSDRNACYLAIEAAKVAWSRWQKARKR